MASNTYSSMREAAYDLKLPVELLKAAKVHPDCDAWQSSGRIDCKKLKDFIEAHKDDLSKESEDSIGKWKTLLTKYNAQIAEKQLEEMEGKYVLRTDIETEIKAIALAQKTLLRSRLLQELPQKLVGLTVPQMTLILEATMTDVCNLMRGLKTDI